MTLYVSSISVDNVMDALGPFVELFLGGGSAVRGDVNRVALPPAPCAVMTEINQADIDLPFQDYQPDDDTATIHGGERIDIQIDFYGEAAGEYCKAVKSALRSLWGCDKFPSNIKPLYSSDPHQAPLTTGEQQYERRWILTVSLQYNPMVIVPQQFAETAIPTGLVPVDIFYGVQ